MEIILDLIENYPPQVTKTLMNHIGTHDTERALTVLAGEPQRGHGRQWQSARHLTRERRAYGLKMMRLASLMQFTLPGVPCVYYGDEAGMEGYRDPFNRACYPWGNEDAGLIEWYRMLGTLRTECSALKQGEFVPLYAADGCMAYLRRDEKSSLLCAFNAGGEAKRIPVPPEWRGAKAWIGTLPGEGNELFLEPQSCAALQMELEKADQISIK